MRRFMLLGLVALLGCARGSGSRDAGASPAPARLGALAPLPGPTTVAGERGRIEALIDRWTPVGPAGEQNAWVSFADRVHTALERQALQAIVDHPSKAGQRGFALQALSSDVDPSLASYWAGFERRPDFSDSDVPAVVAGLVHTEPAQVASYVRARLDREAWARAVVREQAQAKPSDPVQWPALTDAQLEKLTREPAAAPDRIAAWCALFRRAQGKEAAALRDSLLGEADPVGREAAVRCGPPLSRPALEALAASDAGLGDWAAERYFDVPQGSTPIPVPDLVRLAASPDPDFRARADEALRDRLSMVFDGERAGAVTEPPAKELEAFFKALRGHPRLIAQSATIASLVGQELELRGQTDGARLAYVNALGVETAAHAPGGSRLAPVEAQEACRAIFNLARLGYALGRAHDGDAAVRALTDFCPRIAVDAVFPPGVYSGDGQELRDELVARYENWLRLDVATSRDLKEVVLTLQNHGSGAHVLRLVTPGWTSAAAAAPDDIAIWVGGRIHTRFGGAPTSPSVERTLGPGEVLVWRLPLDLTHEPLPFRLGAVVDLQVDHKPSWRVEAVAFRR